MIKNEHKIIAGLILGIAVLNFLVQYRNSKKMDEIKKALIKE